jgi:hypothetical protein
LVLLAAAVGCGRAGGAAGERIAPAAGAESTSTSLATDPSRPAPDRSQDSLANRVETLRSQGRFEQFIDAALNAAADEPDDVTLQLLKCEALLASGRAGECEEAAIRAGRWSSEGKPTDLTARAIKLYAIARFRQGKPLDDPQLAEHLTTAGADAGLRALAFWRNALDGRAPYALESSASVAQMEAADVQPGSIPHALAAIQARANSVHMAVAFIDTGAQHTLMTTAAAKAANIAIGAPSTQLVGFKGLTAAPGLIKKLELGELVLHDVPVLVGDSAPLVALGAQLSLGTELLQHVRFRIDYPARRVTAEPANYPGAQSASPVIATIPVWTFSQICLARGQLPTGAMARVLVDSGDSKGTFVSYRWARRHIPKLQGVGPPLLFRFKKRGISLESLEVGSLSLSNWPVEDTIPNELDRLNLVDVMLGHDLLWPYQLTIDLPARLLELRSGTSPPVSHSPIPDNREP